MGQLRAVGDIAAHCCAVVLLASDFGGFDSSATWGPIRELRSGVHRVSGSFYGNPCGVIRISESDPFRGSQCASLSQTETDPLKTGGG